MMPNITNFETQRGKLKRDFRLSGIQTGIGGQILKKLNDDEVKELSRSDRKFA